MTDLCDCVNQLFIHCYPISAAGTDACTGRRKSLGRQKKFLTLDNIENVESKDNQNDLNSSLDEEVETDREDRNLDGKKFLTIWTTSFSTKTATLYEVNTSVTVTVSAQCALAPTKLPGC